MFINTYTELKDFIFRQLGSESHSIEISDQNFTDIYNKNLKYLQEHSEDGVNRKYILTNLTSKNSFLQDNVLAVLSIYVNSSSTGTGSYAYKGVSPIYDLIKDGEYNSASYLMLTDQINDLRKIFNKRVQYTYNTESHRLIIGETIDSVVIEILETEDVDYLYDNELFLKLIERDCWRIWQTNVGAKYSGNQIGNGITLNLENMKEREQELTELIDKLMDEEAYDFLAPRKI